MRRAGSLPPRQREPDACAERSTVARCWSSGRVIAAILAATAVGVAVGPSVVCGDGRSSITTWRAAPSAARMLSFMRVRTDQLAHARRPSESADRTLLSAGTDCPIPTARDLALTLKASANAAAIGERLTASAAIGVVAEDGAPIGPQTKRIDIWWDLDPHRWWTALTGKPVSASGGRPDGWPRFRFAAPAGSTRCLRCRTSNPARTA